MKLIAVAFITVLSVTQCFADSIEFFWGTEKVRSINLKDPSSFDSKSMSLISSNLYNPFRKYKKDYEGYDFFSLLDKAYGPRWREADSITFTAMDGFIQVASVKNMLQRNEAHSGILAIKEKNHSGFESFEKNGKFINPGPYYLVWTKFDGRSVAEYDDSLKWPYQLKAIKILKVSKP